MTEVALVILASGMSKRMGKAKSLLAWPDDPLIQNQYHTAQLTNLDVYMSVSDTNVELINYLEQHNLTFLKVEKSSRGMGHSMACITKQLGSYQGILFWAVDQPFMHSEHLENLHKSFLKNPECIFYSTSQNLNMGIPVLFPRRVFKKLEALDGDKGAQRIVQEDSNSKGVLCESKVLQDMDNLEDYRTFYKREFGKFPAEN